MRKVGLEHFDVGAEAVLTQALRREGGDAPVLPLAIEHVRWRTDSDPGQQLVLTRPGLAAGAIGAHGQVGDQADAHASATGRGLGRFQSMGDQPLAEGVITQLIGLFEGETGHRALVRAAQFVRPGAPVAAAAFAQTLRMDGLEAAMLLERFAAGGAKCLETFPQRGGGLAKVFVQLP